jgi:hypothetical protein
MAETVDLRHVTTVEELQKRLAALEAGERRQKANMIPNWNEIACTAYETYAQVVRAEQQTLAVPEWEDLPPRMHEAWRQAVKAACEALENQ